MPKDKDREIEWPEPQPDPDEEPFDRHEGPLDDPEDGRWLRRDDPRRLQAERDRGRPFDDDEVGYEGER
jgi:hypothetical protein